MKLNPWQTEVKSQVSVLERNTNSCRVTLAPLESSPSSDSGRNDRAPYMYAYTAIYIKKLQHKSHTTHTPHTRTNFGCCIKNNIVVWSTKIRKFIQRIAFWCYGHHKNVGASSGCVLLPRFPDCSFVCATARTSSFPST